MGVYQVEECRWLLVQHGRLPLYCAGVRGLSVFRELLRRGVVFLGLSRDVSIAIGRSLVYFR